jgi:GDP-L-fucose synthase
VKVLVTGGSGFLGSHVVERLRADGVDPFVALHENYDLTKSDDAHRLFSAAQPELVFHLAAEVGGIGANLASPGRFWYANMLMGAHVLEESRKAGVDKLVLVGTVCSYPKETRVPFREEDLWNGYPEETNAPYGVAKRALSVGAQAYRDQYALNTIFLLPVNLYGPRDDFNPETSHVIPALIRKMVDAKERGEESVVLWGDGSPTREFLYVEDCADALWLAAQRYEGSDPVNLGTGEEISIADLTTLVAAAVEYDGSVIWDTSKPNGQPRRKLDTSRAAERFGFEAKTSLHAGLDRTVAWFMSARAGAGA